MLANSVSPPSGGKTLAHRIVAMGGALRKLSSVCQTSVENGGLSPELSSTISAGLSGRLGEKGWIESSPKCRAKAIC